MAGQTVRAAGANRSAHVKDVFENSGHYLRQRGVDILFRQEAVRAFAHRIGWTRLLDIGCGDGTISLQLLEPGKQMTLLDLSASMTHLVRQNIPDSMADQVEVRNENFMNAVFDGAPFDLVVTVGVLAHVDSLDAFLAKVRSILRPGGHVILEFTDCRHPVGQVGRFFDRLKEIVAPAKYPTNKLSHSQVFPVFAAHQVEVLDIFRYARLPLPAVARVLPLGLQHHLYRSVFGTPDRNTHTSWGNEYICVLKAADTHPR